MGVKLELSCDTNIQSLLKSVAARASGELHSYPPQAIQMLCWGMLRSRNTHELTGVFAENVANQAMSRMDEFEYLDLASMLCSMSKAKLGNLDAVRQFAVKVVNQCSLPLHSCDAAGTPQILLSIACSACKLQVPGETIVPLAMRIQELCSGVWMHTFTDIDYRQWTKVCSYCKPGVCDWATSFCGGFNRQHRLDGTF